MAGFEIANLDDMLEIIGEDTTKAILANYSCPMNPDIEDFLQHKAIDFSRQALARTHLVFAEYRGERVLVGYFALAQKTFFIPRKRSLSKNLRKRIAKFAQKTEGSDVYEIPAPLIAQLGKNYTDGYDALISGDELLTIACNKIRDAQSIIGGKIAYLECSDHPSLIRFYERNGFIEFDRRQIDRREMDMLHTSCLVQMLRYF